MIRLFNNEIPINTILFGFFVILFLFFMFTNVDVAIMLFIFMLFIETVTMPLAGIELNDPKPEKDGNKGNQKDKKSSKQS